MEVLLDAETLSRAGRTPAHPRVCLAKGDSQGEPPDPRSMTMRARGSSFARWAGERSHGMMGRGRKGAGPLRLTVCARAAGPPALPEPGPERLLEVGPPPSPPPSRSVPRCLSRRDRRRRRRRGPRDRDPRGLPAERGAVVAAVLKA